MEENQIEENQIEENKIEENQTKELVLGKNEYQLSSGVIIKINNMDMSTSNVARDLMLGVFKNIKLDKKGNVSTDADPVKSANAIIELQNTLLSNFVEMVNTIEEELKKNSSLDKKWLKKLNKSPMLVQNVDLQDEDDLNYLFLKYVGFASQEDWALLIEKTVGKQNQQ